MMRYVPRGVVRDSVVIAVLLGIPAGVLSNVISNSLASRKPNWLYAVAMATGILLVISTRILVFMARELSRQHGKPPGTAAPAAGTVAISKMPPQDRMSVGQVLGGAATEVVFFGISAKRTVTEDAFRRALDHLENKNLRIRFLLLDPSSTAFEERAVEEGESSDDWRIDHRVTLSRLRGYRRDLHLNIEVRYYSSYPIWRAIIVDRSRVYASTFLPGRRGTEAFQYAIDARTEELAYGIVNSYHSIWKSAKVVPL